MGLGAFAAIGQTNIKRLLAYSAIGNIGYALIGLAAGSPEGARGVIIYMVIYVAMTLGAFACVLAMRRPQGWWRRSTSSRGWRDQPGPRHRAGHLSSRLPASRAGRLLRKFYVFAAAVKQGLWPLAVFGVLASVVGAYYYVRIVKIMFIDAAKEGFLAVPAKAALVMGLAGLFMLLYVVGRHPSSTGADAAARTLF